MNCTLCGERIKADTASVTINVAPEHAHEAPAGHYHLRAIKNQVENCFVRAIEAHKGVSLPSSNVAGG